MIAYTIVGTVDLIRAREFYNPIFEAMKRTLCYEDDQVVSWGDVNDDTVPRFFVCYPYDNNTASVGNGAMTAFRVGSATEVDELHAIAMRGGASDEGKPGFRPESYGDKFYVAYIRDLDGNKLAFACYDGKANP